MTVCYSVQEIGISHVGQAVFVIEPDRQQAIVIQCLSALSLTLRSEGMVPSRTVAVKRCKASAHRVPHMASCPVVERIVAAIYLASALLGSLRHS